LDNVFQVVRNFGSFCDLNTQTIVITVTKFVISEPAIKRGMVGQRHVRDTEKALPSGRRLAALSRL
jgi:hypothetical protein